MEAVQNISKRSWRAPPFAGSDRLRRLLRYLVVRTLNGETNGLKEYSIGLDVFDRGTDYNPQIDSTVRVHAGKLRDKLREYYLTDGRDSSIRIEFEKGSYAPAILPAQPGRGKDPAKKLRSGDTVRFWIAGAHCSFSLGPSPFSASIGKRAPSSQTVRFNIAGPWYSIGVPVL